MNLNPQDLLTPGLRGFPCGGAATTITARFSVRKASAVAAAMFLFLTSGYAAAYQLTGRWMDPAYGSPSSSFGTVSIPKQAAVCFGGAPRHIYVQGMRVSLMSGVATSYPQVVTANVSLYRYNSTTQTWPRVATYQQNSPVMSYDVFQVEIPQGMFTTTTAGYYKVKVKFTWWFFFQSSYWLKGSSQDVNFNLASDYAAMPELQSAPGPGYCRLF